MSSMDDQNKNQETVIAKLPNSEDKVILAVSTDKDPVIIGNAPKNAEHDLTLSDDVKLVKTELTSEPLQDEPISASEPDDSTNDKINGSNPFLNTQYLILGLVVIVIIQYKMGYFVKDGQKEMDTFPFEPLIKYPVITGIIFLSIGLFGERGLPSHLNL